jgi:hypothetical protein
MRTTSQCKPRIPPSLAGRNRASQVLIVMHHLSHPLPQAKSVIDKSKDLLHNQLDSNTDTESIKQASDQTKSIPNPPEQCAICRGRSMKELRPTDCKNPLDQSSNTEATKHKTFAAGSKRWSTFETSIRSVRSELRTGFRFPAAHSRRIHTLNTSRGQKEMYQKWLVLCCNIFAPSLMAKRSATNSGKVGLSGFSDRPGQPDMASTNENVRFIDR